MVVSADHIKTVVESLHAAHEANRDTPGRQGNLICLGAQQGDEVFVAADLHGNRVNYDRLVQLADLHNSARRHLVMQEVCHGGPTYPLGGGCMSHLLLEDIAALKNEFPERFHFILSNHELAELTDFPIMKASRMLNLSFRNGLQEMYGDATEEVRKAYLDFLGSCPLAVQLDSGVFISHSVPDNVDSEGFDTDVLHRPLDEDDYKPRAPVFRLVWGRDFRQKNADAFAALVDAKVMIHGHEPSAEGFHVPNDRQVILDSCGDKACYVVLPTSAPVSHRQVVERVRHL